MSDAQKGLPAWIELEWDRPQEINFVQITFDTGMHRPLTQTYLKNFYGSELIWGPQPETVKKYKLLFSPDGKEPFTLIKEEMNNHQRRNVLPFSTRKVKKLRLLLEETWGVMDARVFEIRCYNKTDV